MGLCAVSRFALGTMTFGVATEETEARRQLDRFLAAWRTLVDTPGTYGAEASEEIIGVVCRRTDRPVRLADRWASGRPACRSYRRLGERRRRHSV
jgi:aryl-alcohol dehydrogenase-like predicted oxidoreductase